MKPSLFLLLLTISLSSFAIGEKDLEHKLHSEIFPFYDAGTSHFYKGVGDKKIHYHVLGQESECALLVLPGRTEPTRKYAELAYDLKDMGCDIVLWDPRGQGFSERLLKDPYKGHVEKYQDYMDDFNLFWNRAMTKYKKVGIVAHSMGAAIALATLARNQYPIVGLALSSPMMEIRTQDLPEAATLWAMKVFSLVGKNKEYVPGRGPFTEETPFEENNVTSSVARYQLNLETARNEGGESLQMGGPTNNWLKEGIEMTRFLKQRNAKKALAHYPILLFQAGKDEYSKEKRQKKFCDKHPQCKLVFFKDSKHEMFQERDEIRDQVLSEVKSFFRTKL